MKAKAIFLVLLMFINGLLASGQVSNGTMSSLSPSSGDNSKYGTDLIIHDDATQDQNNSCIGVAPNGWLYACYSLITGGFQVARSTDNGVTWTVTALNQPGMDITSMGLVVCGNDANDIRIFVAVSLSVMANRTTGSIVVYTFDATLAGLGEQMLHSMPNAGYHDVAIATDFPFPSSGASPYSIGVLFTTNSPPADTAIFMVSGDGGGTFTTQKVLGISWGNYGQVALAHGRSPNYQNGIYFAAIAEPTTGSYGKIWETHNQTSFNSDFTFMVSMDDAAGLSNLCKNPSIACQHNNLANGVNGLSVAILFERFSGAGNYNIAGTSNKSPLGGGFWSRLDVTGNTKKNLQPDINFDALSSKFLVTYFDSTSQQLNYVSKNQELTDPSSWEMIKTGYNDQANLTHPFPRVMMHPVKQKAFHIWNGVRSGGNGVSLFEPEYSVTGIADDDVSASDFVRRIFPDPATDRINFEISVNSNEEIILSIYDQSGKIVRNHKFSPGKGIRMISSNLTSLPAGTYLYLIRAHEQIGRGTFIISR